MHILKWKVYEVRNTIVYFYLWKCSDTQVTYVVEGVNVKVFYLLHISKPFGSLFHSTCSFVFELFLQFTNSYVNMLCCLFKRTNMNYSKIEYVVSYRGFVPWLFLHFSAAVHSKTYTNWVKVNIELKLIFWFGFQVLLKV